MSPILKPALHTLWQSLAAGLATWYASVNLGAVHNVDDAKKLALSGIAAGGAALLSAALHVGKRYGPAMVRSLARGRVSKDESVMIDAILDAVPAYAAPKWDLVTRDNSAPVLAQVIADAKARGARFTATTDSLGVEWPEGPAPDARGAD